MTTSTADEAILGRPIKGNVTYYTQAGQAPQYGEEEFIAALDAIWATGEVHHVIWRQDTPYFNDGDACVFGTAEVYAYPNPELDPAHDPNGESSYWDEQWQGLEYINTYSPSRYRPDETRVSAETIAAVKKFTSQMKHFQSVCLKHFGDPAEVTATPEGFSVEYYDHD